MLPHWWLNSLREAYRQADERDMQAAGKAPRQYTAQVEVVVIAYDWHDARHILDDMIERMNEEAFPYDGFEATLKSDIDGPIIEPGS